VTTMTAGPAAIKALLLKLGVAPSAIAHLILPCPFAKLDQTLAGEAGIDPARVRDNLAGTVGDTGAAHALLLLAHALEDAKPGEKVVFIGDCARWEGRIGGDLVKIESLSVLHIPSMESPLVRREVVKQRQFFDHLLRWTRKGLERLDGLLRRRIALCSTYGW